MRDLVASAEGELHVRPIRIEHSRQIEVVACAVHLRHYDFLEVDGWGDIFYVCPNSIYLTCWPSIVWPCLASPDPHPLRPRIKYTAGGNGGLDIAAQRSSYRTGRSRGACYGRAAPTGPYLSSLGLPIFFVPVYRYFEYWYTGTRFFVPVLPKRQFMYK